MDEKDASQLNADNKVTSGLPLQETETQKIPSEADSEPQLDVHPEVYADGGTENEVITIITQDGEGEVYIYERNNIENSTTENPVEFIQVCDSNNTFEEVNNSEEKEVNVDGIEEEDEEGVTTENVGVEEVESVVGIQKQSDSKDASTTAEGSPSKNFKNVILEDWEVEVPQIIKNHESENCTEAFVVANEPQEVVTYSNENCSIVDVAGSEVILLNEQSNEHPKSSSKQENSVDVSNDSSITEKTNNIGEQNKNLEVNSCVVENENEKEKNSVQAENSTDGSSSHGANVNSLNSSNDNGSVSDGTAPHSGEKKLETLKCSKSVTKEEIVKILDDTSERNIRPIVGGKDLFFSIELTKRLNQKLSLGKNKESEGLKNESDSCNNNNTVDDRQKIAAILESDDIRDWKSVPSKSDVGPKENGNDMEISKAIKSMEESDSNVNTAKKPAKKPSVKKIKVMDKELERTLALRQLREEFPTTRKRSRTTKKVNHVPFLASTVLEKAMTSPEVTTALKPGPPRRRPCYLPENATYSKAKDSVETEKVTNSESLNEVNEIAPKNNSALAETDFIVPGKSIPNPVVKTYSVKRKSTDAESDIKTTLEAVAKALNESSEEVSESKPKKQKTVTKENKNKKILIKKKRKLKSGVKSEKKMKSELEKLLGDEGAVRMLYDTQHGDPSTPSPKRTKFKTTTGIKKDLVLKTKLVKNAVMRLSGVGADGVVLRGKRRSNLTQVDSSSQEEEPLFSSTPSVVLYKPKKKQRAEASRILYRHSSSESFDSSEGGYRRTSFDADVLNVEASNNTQVEESEPNVVDLERVVAKGKPKKSEIIKKRLKKMQDVKQRRVVKEKGAAERLSTDSVTKLNLSNVPVRKSSRPRVVSKKYSIWSSTSMDSLSVESLGLKKLKKASTELGKKLNCKELTIMQYEHLVQIVLAPTTTVMKNSVNSEVLQELLQVFGFLSKEESCRVVLLSSRGNTFCQGIDINRIISFSESERKKGVLQLVRGIRDFITCLASFKKPIIAGVQGAAIGLGVTLLPYCDLIICSDTASFFTPYVKLGQASEGAPIRTFPLINRQLVSELLFKSHKMTAADALRYGLVTQVIPEERFEEDLIMISRNMAAQPAQGMQSIKFLLRKSEQWDVSKVLEAEGELLEEHWNSSECLNNMVKFLNSGELQLRQTTVG